MTSLLATQLNKLRVPEGQTGAADYRRRKSLIHSAIELNKIDAAAHLERAQKAFLHLLNVDPSLQEFRDCFFSEERINFEPSMQTPDQKAALDQIIEHFYLRVSQHLLLGITLDALEWLVYRFQTHLYNMEAMLQAVLPYHATNLFPKFLQLFDFTAHNRRWHWLKPLANQGSPLSRTDLVRMASRDESLLAFICQLVQRAFKAFGAADESRLRLFVNLYAQVTLGVLMKPLDEVRLSKCVNCLNFYLLKGMRSASDCYRHSAYQIVQLLAVKHRLNGPVLHMWIKRLLKSSYKRDPAQVCLLIALLCKTQKCKLPDEFTETFLAACADCNSEVLNDFPEIVCRSTETVDIMFDDQATVQEGKTVDIDTATVEPMEEDNAKQSTAKANKRSVKAVIEEKSAAQLAAEAEFIKLLELPVQPASAAASKSSSASEVGNDVQIQEEQKAEAAEAPVSSLLVVGSLIRLLASPVQSIRRQSLSALRNFLTAARPADSADSGPSDESEEDALVWDTAEAVLTDSKAIEHDRLWVMRQQLAPFCSRLVFMSMAELVGGLVGPLTPIQRQCLLGQLDFLPEAQLASLVGGGGAGDDKAAETGARLLLQAIRLSDSSVAKAVAMKVTPAVFNRLSKPMKLVYLTEGLGSTPLTEDSDVLTIASGYNVETVVYLDAMANLFGLVPTRASIQNLSAKRKSISQQGNVYADMPEADRRQARLLLRLVGCDGRSDQLDGGLQLVIRLLEVLQILVQAHFRISIQLTEESLPNSTDDHDQDQLRQTSAAAASVIVSDIGLCLVATDRAAQRTPDADGKVSGLADLIPLQAVLDCARSISDRQCQYAAVGLLCRLCRLAPASAAACCRGLLDFLAGGGFFGRADRHSEELWLGLVGSVLPAYAKCNPSGVPLLVQLLVAYEVMSPSRRPEIFAQLVTAVGPGCHLWALLLLLNRRCRTLQYRRAKRRHQQLAAPDAADNGATDPNPAEDADSKQPPIRRRRLSESVSLSEPDAPAVSGAAFDSLGSSVLAAFPAHEQLLACAGQLRYLLRRIDPSAAAAAAAAAAISFLELEKHDQLEDELGADDYFGFDELDDEAEAVLLPAAAADVPGQLEAGLALIAAHLGRRDLLSAIADASSTDRADQTATAMTQLLGALVNVLLWATSAQQQQQQRHLAALCVRTIERAEQAVPGAQFLRVVCGLLARQELAVRRKALDLMLSKLTGLDRSAALPVLKQSLLDCLAGVEKNWSGSQVALICGRELVRLLGQSEPKLVMNFCLGVASSDACCMPNTVSPASAAECAVGAADSNSNSSSSWESFGCALLVFAEAVKQLGIESLPLVARLMPRLLPCLQRQSQTPTVVLLASFAFLQQCCVSMVDLMVPYLAELLPVTIDLMLTSDSQLKPKLRIVLSTVARGIHPSQLLPTMQRCLSQLQSLGNKHRPWQPAEQWARLLRLNLETTVLTSSADKYNNDTDEDDDDELAEGGESLADYEAELADLFGRLLDSVFEHDSDNDNADSDSGDDEDLEGDDEQDEKAQSRLVAQLGACLIPLPPASRAMLLQSLQDWSSDNATREAAYHRLLAKALTAPAVPGLPGLLFELDAPQHAAALLSLESDVGSSGGSAQQRRLARWLLAYLEALFPAAASSLSLDLMDSLGSLLVDRLVASADPAKHLLPCLVAYAQAASGDEALLKPLIRRLCDRGCRHANSRTVRLTSLQAIQRLLDCLGDDFIDSVAADCVPALAELAEDDSEEVERLAQRLLTEIERRAVGSLDL